MLNKIFGRSRVTKTPVELLADDIATLNIENFKSVYSADLSIIELFTYCTSIIKYNKFLTSLIDAFLSDRIIGRHEIDLPGAIMPLPEFFTDDLGMCIDSMSATKDFFDLSIQYLQLYEDYEQLTSPTFTQEKNLLMTQNIHSNVVSVIKILQTMQ